MQRIEASREAIDRLLAQSKECEEKGELKTAIAYAQQAFATTQEANAVAFLPEIQSQLARLQVYAGEHDAARAHALAVLEQAPGSIHAAGASFWELSMPEEVILTRPRRNSTRPLTSAGR